MKISAITMVYRDYWALSQWYAHFSRHLGSVNLFIVAHGHDPKVSAICPKANVITIPRDRLAGFDRMRGQLLNSIQDGLGVIYDWVIRTDTDELICLDPAHYASFPDLFQSHGASDALFALGVNIAESGGDGDLRVSDAALSHRRCAVFSGHYSKAWAVRRGTHLVRHGIVLDGTAGFILPKGVYLAHLKYANIDALSEVNVHRTEIAGGAEKGLPGKAWSNAEQDAKKFYEALDDMPLVEWVEASRIAYEEIIANPVIDEKQNVLRAKSVNFKFKTTLPDWFKYC